ncbi:MAG: hypothetical protein JWN86_3365 [Planctomycetota bacterium]|nr:hypothetical protein [Planctomycetota bacterium]
METAFAPMPTATHAFAGDTLYRFSVQDFYAMIDAGLFPRETRIELWEGQIYEKMAESRPHSTAGQRCGLALSRWLPTGWYLVHEDSLELAPGKVPLPDLMVLRGSPDTYEERYPAPPDVGLLVEVARTSHKGDTGPKLESYARASIVSYWVINLVAKVVQVHREPLSSEGRYAVEEVFGSGQAIPFYLDGMVVGEIAVDDLLPRLKT